MTNATPTRNKHLGRPGNGGEFAPDERSESAILLDGAVEEWNVARESIGAISTQLSAITAAEAQDVAAVHDALQDGAWNNLRIGSVQYILAKEIEGDFDWGLLPIAREVYATDRDANPHTVDDADADNRYVARRAADDAATALAYRHLIGTDPLWTQESYDNHTRAWATVFGPVHPDDVAAPESWTKRPLDAEVVDQLSGDVAEGERERIACAEIAAVRAEIEATPERKVARLMELHHKAIRAITLLDYPTASSIVVEDQNGEGGSPMLMVARVEDAEGNVLSERDWDEDHALDDYTSYLDRDLDALEQLTHTGWEDTWRHAL